MTEDTQQELHDILKYPPAEYWLDYAPMNEELYTECADTIDDIMWKHGIAKNRLHHFKGVKNQRWLQALLDIKEYRFQFATKHKFTPFIIRDVTDI